MVELVILPGLDGTTALLSPFCAALSELGVSARAIAYPTNEPLGYAELEGLVRAQLPADPFVLLGESFSGPLALSIASSHPPGLVGLVLSTTFARSPVPQLRSLAGLLGFAPARPPMAILAWWLLGPWATPQLKEALLQALQSVGPSTLRARAAAALRADCSKVLPSVAVPSLCLVASHDRLLPPHASRELAAGLSRCHVATIAGPHLLLQAAPKDCAKAVAVFALGLGPNNSSKPTPLRGAA